MSYAGNGEAAADPGLSALVTMLRLQGIGADAAQLRHHLGLHTVGVPEMLRCAKQLGLKARSYKTSWARLASAPMPGIAVLHGGDFVVLGKVGGDRAIVQSPQSPRPSLMTRDELEAVWDGELVVMSRRSSLVDLSRRFDITWFLGAIHKYRHVLGGVLVSSFFLQL